MVLDGQFNILETKIKNIIKNNDPEKSIKLISEFKLPESNKLIGKDGATKIYRNYAENSVEYDSKKYQNNINSYKQKVDKNISNSRKISKKNIK